MNDLCSMCAVCLGSAWYSLLSGLTFNEDLPLKHPIPLNTFVNSLYSFCVVSVLPLLFILLLGPGRKYSMLSLLVIIGLSLFSNFEILPLFVSTSLLHQIPASCLHSVVCLLALGCCLHLFCNSQSYQHLSYLLGCS